MGRESGYTMPITGPSAGKHTVSDILLPLIDSSSRNIFPSDGIFLRQEFSDHSRDIACERDVAEMRQLLAARLLVHWVRR